MAIIATTGSVLSDVLMQDSFPIVENYNYQHKLPVDEAGNVNYKVGQVLLWDSSAAYRKIVADDFTSNAIEIPTTDGAAADGAKFVVVVGFDSLGDTKETVVVGTAGDFVVGLFRGDASVKASGLVWDAALNDTQKASVVKQLEKQGISVKATTGAVSSSFYGAVSA
jgi:hypothetical protein